MLTAFTVQTAARDPNSQGLLHSMRSSRPFGHGRRNEAQNTSDQAAPADEADQKQLRLLGPSISDDKEEKHTHTKPPGSSIAPTTLSHWLHQAKAQAGTTTFTLYVRQHRDMTKLRRVLPSLGATTAWPAATQKALALPAATHTLTVSCDVKAPKARLEVYVMAPRSAGNQVVAPPPHDASSLAPAPGWLLASATVKNGFHTLVELPLVLDPNWAVDGAVPIALVLESLGDDGLTLKSRNAYVAVWHCVPNATTSGEYACQGVSQHGVLGGLRLELHELFGLSSTSGADGAVPPPAAQSDAPAPALGSALPNAPVVDPLLMDTGATGSGPGETPECPVCMSEPSTTLLLPCTHAMCLECAVRVRSSVQASRQQDREQHRQPRRQYACPLCRSTIQSMVQLMTPEQAQVAARAHEQAMQEHAAEEAESSAPAPAESATAQHPATSEEHQRERVSSTWNPISRYFRSMNSGQGASTSSPA